MSATRQPWLAARPGIEEMPRRAERRHGLTAAASDMASAFRTASSSATPAFCPAHFL
jgi:hypothetical protein